ncbi:ATP-binding protein [Allonocardiopsis opalescens]|uniref:ATP-binding protein n=1 Tax=Allonocardiopsis opalescens TaxID=1144618 RepID=UPI001474DF0D|nr:helix-turn-helix domain-containing protein [Allonocardiopsis opalescens]
MSRRSRLVRRRVELGLTQERLAELVRVDARTISRWENGRSSPDEFNRRDLARVLEVPARDLGHLLAFVDEPVPAPEEPPAGAGEEPGDGTVRLLLTGTISREAPPAEPVLAEVAAGGTVELRGRLSIDAMPVGRLPPPRAEFVVRDDLPRDLPDFTGRTAQLDALLAVARSPAPTAEAYVVSGPGGVGKTALAVRAAHRLAEHFPDGRLFLSLHGYAVGRRPVTTLEALGTLLRAVGVPAEALPETVDERAALWRATLADRRVLVVLDNAVSSTQVRELLPASPGSLALVTSRSDLSGLAGARHLSLDMLKPAGAEAMLAAILGSERVGGEPAAVREVVRLCGGLPLALRIVAGRMASRQRWTFAHVAERFKDERRRFEELRADDQSVAAVFAVSHQSLSPLRRRAFLLLGLMIGTSVDAYGTAALLDIDPHEADDVLQDMVSACLLTEEPAGRYRFHDLIGAYARQRALAELTAPDRAAALRRFTDYCTATQHRAAELLDPLVHDYRLDISAQPAHSPGLPDVPAAVAWLDAERETITALIEHAAAHGRPRLAWQLAYAFWRYCFVRGHTDLWLSTHERALTATRAAGDDEGTAITLTSMGAADYLTGRFDHAMEALNEALGLFAGLGDERGQARARINRGAVLEYVGRYSDALREWKPVLATMRETGDRRREASLAANVAHAQLALGRLDEAVSYARAALDIELPGWSSTHPRALWVLGSAYCRLGDHAAAREHLDTSIELFGGFDAAGEAYARSSLGVLLREQGDLDGAVAAHLAALDLCVKSAQRAAEADVLNELGATYTRAGRPADAAEAYGQALMLARDRRDRHALGLALLGLGALRARGGEAAEAVPLLTEALDVLTGLGVPEAEEARAELLAVDGGAHAVSTEARAGGAARDGG